MPLEEGENQGRGDLEKVEEEKQPSPMCDDWKAERDRLIEARRNMNPQERINDPNLNLLLVLIDTINAHC
ncbi:MAG: hypothetical protein OXU36_09305 [Candidatus Poribacteria bacterium]|nr:hypothetical protein [Candidatus Poribacteria bacterium]